MNKTIKIGMLNFIILAILLIPLFGSNLLQVTAQETNTTSWDNPVTNPESQVIYGSSTNYQFQLTWMGNETPENVTIIHDFNGTTQEEPITETIGTNYIFTISDLAAGTYHWQFSAGNETSQEYIYQVQKATPLLFLYLNEEEQNLNVSINETINMTGLTNSENEVSVELLEDEEVIGIQNESDTIIILKEYNETGEHSIKIVHNETENYTYSQIERVVNVLESEPPIVYWSSILTNPESQVIFGTATNYQYKTNWIANNSQGIDKVLITHNFKGNQTTQTVNNSQGETYAFTISTLAAGEYFWFMTANTTDGAFNQTANQSYTVQKATPQIALYINSVTGNTQAQQNTPVNITIEADLDVIPGLELYINGLPTPIDKTGSSVEYLETFNTPADYNITVKYNGTQNKTSKQVSSILTINPLTLTVAASNSEYVIGQLAGYSTTFPSNAVVSVEICGPLPPGGAGFVECYQQPDISGVNSPFARSHRYTNKSGTYMINVATIHNGVSLLANDNYTVANSLVTSVDGQTSLVINEDTTFIGSASGGIPPFTYKWILSNGSVINGDILNIRYPTVGTFSTNFSVVDNAGNANSQKFNIVVSKSYTVTVLVKDTNTNGAIDGARVEFGDYVEWTDSNGKAVLNVPDDKYKLEITADGYKKWLQYDVKIDSDRTSTYKLSIEDSTSGSSGSSATQEVSFTLKKPLNNVKLIPGDQKFEVFVVPEKSSTCQIYLTEGSNTWSKQLKEFTVTQSSTIEATENIKENTDYSWFAECKSSTGTYTSEVYSFTTKENSNAATTTASGTSSVTSADGVVDAGELRRKLEEAMQNLDSLEFESKLAAEDFDLRNVLQKTLRDYDRILRDINNLKFRTDLTESEKNSKRQEYRDQLTQIETETPILINTEKSEEFIAYPKKEELRQIAVDYAEVENIDDVINDALLNEIQNSINVKTRISHVKMTMISGTVKDVTLISKIITYSEELDEKDFLIESIPKEVETNAKNIEVFNEFTIIKEDPLLRFEPEVKIVYALDGFKNFEAIKSIHTIAFTDKIYQKGGAAITGRTIFTDIDLTSPFSLVILLIIAIFIYIVYAYDLGTKVQFWYYSIVNKKAIQKLESLIKDANDYIREGTLDRANLLFKEIRLIYEQSKEPIRKEVYHDANEVLGAINEAYFEKLFNEVESEKENGTYNLDKIKRMLFAYNELGKDVKTNYQALVPKYISIYQSRKGLANE